MNVLVYDENWLKKSVFELDFRRKLLFILLISERLIPNFRRFCDDTKYEGEKVLRNAIDMAWETGSSKSSTVDWIDLAIDCEEIAPDTESYDSMYASAALDAANVASLAMRFSATKNLMYLMEASRLAIDSVDMYVQEAETMDPADPNLESRIGHHSLMQQELKSQIDDIEKLTEESVDSWWPVTKAYVNEKKYDMGSLSIR